MISSIANLHITLVSPVLVAATGIKVGAMVTHRGPDSVSLERAVMPAGRTENSFPVASKLLSATSCVRASGKSVSSCPLKLRCSSIEPSAPMSAGSLASHG